ncbi:MAG: aldo/keto reductase [Ilumatobacter sp.]|uniref:aldo/keto reductase n=1 Tax=Ilumatobacter sp. TaxID=1967498 RepID=UPI002632C517|nr:aldo/keto reductase [Ilumatobacter sp.]MDJ0768885.1 aldo/keto reductase [Ilumatobacter sp.]
MVPTLPFGRTGHASTRVIFGAAALGGMRQERADATLALIDAAGINHIDTAASYGASEDRLQPFLAQHRERFFLATKTGEREGIAARAELERSLARMGVDHVDLIQLHNLVEPDEWEAAFAPGGVVEAMAAARDEGLTRFIGVTGHGLRIASMLVRSLERFDFDSVLFPYNHVLLTDPAYRSDVETLRTLCAQRRVAAQTIKALARGRWPDGDMRKFSWYEPISDPEAIGRAVRHVLATDDLYLNTTSDARLLPAILEAAAGELDPPTEEQMAADVEAFGITPLFDGGALERI